MKRPRHHAIYIAILSVLAISGCGLIFQRIETVAEMQIQPVQSVIKFGDTLTVKCRIKNISKKPIEISTYPGCLIENWWWSYNDTTYKKLRNYIHQFVSDDSMTNH